MTPGEVLKRAREMDPDDAHIAAYEGVARCFTKTGNGPKYLMRLLASFDLVREEAVQAERVRTIERIGESLRHLYAEAERLGLSAPDLRRHSELLPAIQDLQAIQDELRRKVGDTVGSVRDLALALLGVPAHCRPGATVWFLQKTSDVCSECKGSGQGPGGPGYNCALCCGFGRVGPVRWEPVSRVVDYVEIGVSRGGVQARLQWDREWLPIADTFASEAEAKTAVATRGAP